MEIQLGILYWVLIAVGLLILVERICQRTPALMPHMTTLRWAAFVWLLMPLAKKAFIDDVLPPSDAITHEAVAREVADHFHSLRLGQAFSYFEIGNESYRFFLGVFYAISLAPELVTYTVNSALGFWGMLIVLEIGCLYTGCRRAPALAVLFCGFLPSGLLWCSTNLKEGAVLWGICQMLYWTLDGRRLPGAARRGVPLAGMLATGVLRPHIAILWLGAIGFAAVIKSKRYGIGLTVTAAIVACFLSLKIIAPNMYDVLLNEGLTASLSQKYDLMVEHTDQAAQQFIGVKPIPVYTGMTLIMLRPWPDEVYQLGEALAGAEVWLLALWGLFNWRNIFRSLPHLKDANLLGMVVGLLLLGFLFSYMYNMGLVVRQRLMGFPAMLLIYMWPSMARQAAAAAQRPIHGGSGASRAGGARVPSRPRLSPLHDLANRQTA